MKKIIRSKHEAFLQDLIFKYHPSFKSNATLRKHATNNPQWFNIEMLYEETMNIRHGYKKSKDIRIDAKKGKKKAEYKTGTVYLPTHSKCKTSHRVEISGIESQAGVIKQANITASVFNKITNCIDHFFIPQDNLILLINSGGKKGKKRIVGTYNSKTQKYGVKLEQYRVCMAKLAELMN